MSPTGPAVLVAGYALLLLAGAVGLEVWTRASQSGHRSRAASETEDEQVPPEASWPPTEITHFYHGIALLLVVLAGCLAVVGLARYHAEAQVLLLAPVLILVAMTAYWLLPAFLAVNRLLR
jgi:hypothetical protein